MLLYVLALSEDWSGCLLTSHNSASVFVQPGSVAEPAGRCHPDVLALKIHRENVVVRRRRLDGS